jgi:Fic family protein
MDTSSNRRTGDLREMDAQQEKKLNVLYQFLTEREMKYSGGLYHLTQIEFAYNSNHIEGSSLTKDETRLIFETQSILADGSKAQKVDDIIETVNHFRCFDYLLDVAEEPLSEKHIKEFHRILKQSTFDGAKPYFAVGDYKRIENTVGNIETTLPEKVPEAMVHLLGAYHHEDELQPDKTDAAKLQAVIDFHIKFEKIHPFQDGNGRVGRLIMFKECLAKEIMPFVVEDKNRAFYLNGISNYNSDRTQLIETIGHEQDVFSAKYEKLAFPEEKK